MCSDFLIICRVRIGTDKSSPIWNYLSLTEVKNRLYKSHLRLELRNGLKSHWPSNTGSRVTRSMKILVIQHWMSLSENKCHQFQLSSVTQSWPTLCNPMKCSMPGHPVHHQLLESTKTRVHWVSDDIQPSLPLSSPSTPALNLFKHQGLFQWVRSSHHVVKVLEFQLQHQSFQWIFKTDIL